MPFFKYIYWAGLCPLVFMVAFLGRLFSPVVCLFVTTKHSAYPVGRLGWQVVTMPRTHLVWWLTWFDTDDNATDEYWYGMYDSTAEKTQDYYDTHPIYRWYCRVRWLNRNSMYTFNRKFFGLSKTSALAWQYKTIKPLWFGWNNDINIGFKSHKGFEKLMFAGRILGLRKIK